MLQNSEGADTPPMTQSEPPAASSEEALGAAVDPGTPQEPTASGAPARRRRRSRTPRTYPASSFFEALPLAEAIQRFAAGQKIRRLTLFEHLEKSAESGQSRQLVTNSNQYGLTRGSYTADYLELTDEGRLASGDSSLGRARLAARLQLAIAQVEPFNALYERCKNNRIPTTSVLRDFAIEAGVVSDNADECVETFLANARDLGLLTNYAGAERLLTFELLLDELESPPQFDQSNKDRSVTERATPHVVSVSSTSPARVIAEAADLSDVCFLISPIGSDDSPQRQHANLLLGSLIEPALEGLDLRLVRADKISKPGMITRQIIDHIVRAPLVIADLSFGNPNVFYELALRHACRKPVVQIIRNGDHLPFDVGQFRTVSLDMTDIYTLVPQIESYRAEIARQCRAALGDDEDTPDSPLSLFYPGFWTQF